MTGDDFHDGSDVADRARQRADGIAGVGGHDAAVTANSAVRWTKADNPVAGCRASNRAAGILAQREAALACSWCDTGAGGGAGGVMGRVPRISRLAIWEINGAALAPL